MHSRSAAESLCTRLSAAAHVYTLTTPCYIAACASTTSAAGRPDFRPISRGLAASLCHWICALTLRLNAKSSGPTLGAAVLSGNLHGPAAVCRQTAAVILDSRPWLHRDGWASEVRRRSDCSLGLTHQHRLRLDVDKVYCTLLGTQAVERRQLARQLVHGPRRGLRGPAAEGHSSQHASC